VTATEPTRRLRDRLVPVNPTFGRILLATALCSACGEILHLALPLAAYDLSRSEMDLAALRGVTFLPNLLLGVFIGVINDQLLKRRAFTAYVFAQLAILCVLAGLAVVDAISLPALLIGAFGIAGVRYAFGNARIGLVKLAVPGHRLVDANSATTGVDSVIAVAGPAAAGLMLAGIGFGGTLGVCMLAMAVALAVSLTIDVDEPRPPRRSLWKALVEGVQAFRANRVLVAMSIAVLVVNGAEGIYATMLIASLKGVHGGGDLMVGLVLSASGVGALLAAVGTPRIRARLGTPLTFAGPIAATALVYVAAAFAPDVWTLAGLAFAEGFFSTVFVIGLWTFRQETTSAETMGRVAGITGSIFKIGMPPLILLGGFLAESGDISAAFLLAAGLNLATVVGLWFSPLRTAARSVTA
jgi:MFS family permease